MRKCLFAHTQVWEQNNIPFNLGLNKQKMIPIIGIIFCVHDVLKAIDQPLHYKVNFKHR